MKHLPLSCVILVCSFTLTTSAFAQTVFEWKSLNGPKYSDGSSVSVRKLFFNRDGILIAKGSYALFISSNRGSSWSEYRPYFSQEPYVLADIALDTSGNVLVGSPQGIFRFKINSRSWENLNDLLPNGTIYATGVSETATLYIVFSNNDVFRSLDNGVNWTKINGGLTHDNFSFSPMLFQGYDSKVYLAADGKLFSITDETTSWTRVANMPSLSFLLKKDGWFFGTNYEDSVYYKSTNKGTTWTRAHFNTATSFGAMTVDNEGTLYVFNLRSTSNLGDIFYSTNNGQNWKKSLCSCDLRFLACDSLNFLFGGTPSTVLRTILPVSSVWNEDNEEIFTLSSYPNPSSGKTTIFYKLQRASNVKMTLFDTRGIEVLRVSEQGSLGEHEMVLDASQLPNGIYYYRLEAGGLVETRKMVIAK